MLRTIIVWSLYSYLYSVVPPQLFVFLTLWFQRAACVCYVWNSRHELHAHMGNVWYRGEWVKVFEVRDGASYFPLVVLVSGMLPIGIPGMFMCLDLYQGVLRTHRRIVANLENAHLM